LISRNIDLYFKSIPKKALLTRSEEVELSKRIEAGDQEARRIMIERNLRLAISIAKKYARYGSDLEDLIQESNLGLMKAVEKFDWRKGFKFSTYASWWIKQAATRKLSSDSNLLQIPSHTLGNARKIKQVYKEYYEEFKSEPTTQEVSSLLGISEKHIKEALKSTKARNVLSIDKPSSDDNSRTLGEMIPDAQKSIDDIIDNVIIRKHIIKTFKKLSKREELVLRMRFGITDILEDDTNIYNIKEGE
jgi:RNA polymerase primary sigma factor